MKVTILGSEADRGEVVSFVREKLERVLTQLKLHGSEIAVWLFLSVPGLSDKRAEDRLE